MNAVVGPVRRNQRHKRCASKQPQKGVKVRQAKLVGAAIAALLALSAIAAASALAALPEFSPATDRGTSRITGTAQFTEEGSLFAVKCTSSEGESNITGAKGGNFTEHFKSCSTGGGLIKCTGLPSEPTGTITVSGSFRLVYLSRANKEAGIAFEPSTVHFECGENLITVNGCAVGKVTPVNSKTTSFSVALKQRSGRMEPGSYEAEGGGSVSCTLKSEKNGGAAREGGQENTDSITEERAGEIVA